MITFQANYLSSASIQRINISKRCNKTIAFVEINPKSFSDVIAIHKAAIKWDKNGGEGFAYDICQAVNKKIKDRFFALTTQSDNFEHLDFDKILALTQVKDKNKGNEFVEYLQVDPDNSSQAENPQFRHIGAAMLDSLKKLFIDKTIELDSVKNAIPFYRKNGFEDIGKAANNGEKRMRWKHL